MNNTTLTNEDRAIYSRLSMWNGDEAYQYANTVDAEDIDYRAMRLRMTSPSGFNEPLEELVCLEIAEGITYREWCDGVVSA